MSTFFVSENVMLQNMVKKTCEEQNCAEITTFEAIEEIPQLSARSIVLLHITTSWEAAAKQVRALRAQRKDIRIILLSREKLTAKLREELSEATQAIIPEDNGIDTLIGALTVVEHGYRISIDDDFIPANKTDRTPYSVAFDAMSDLKLTKSPEDAKLSNRERAILERLSEGGSNKDIAKDLGIQEATVKVHLRACYRKIGARNRTQAAVWAVEQLSN